MALYDMSYLDPTSESRKCLNVEPTVGAFSFCGKKPTLCISQAPKIHYVSRVPGGQRTLDVKWTRDSALPKTGPMTTTPPTPRSHTLRSASKLAL
jgi:hypothetical protein